MNLKAFLLVGAGGAAGSMARYGVSIVFNKLTHPDPHIANFPYATFTINIIGSLIIGILFGLLARHQWLQVGGYLLLASGFCGGFTTFSTFALENVTFIQKGQSVMAMVYIGVSVVLGLLLCRAGMWLAGWS